MAPMTFVFRIEQSGVKLGQRDIVTDFDASEGDRFEFYGFNTMSFVGTDPFSGAEQMPLRPERRQDVPADQPRRRRRGELVIELAGLIDLAATDFLFVF